MFMQHIKCNTIEIEYFLYRACLTRYEGGFVFCVSKAFLLLKTANFLLPHGGWGASFWACPSEYSGRAFGTASTKLPPASADLQSVLPIGGTNCNPHQPQVVALWLTESASIPHAARPEVPPQCTKVPVSTKR